MKQGIPFDVVFALSNDERLAWLVICGEIDGAKFNWATGEWEKPK